MLQGWWCDVGEAGTKPIAEQMIGIATAADVKIRPTVVVEIGRRGHAAAVAGQRLVDCFDLEKRAVTGVEKQAIGLEEAGHEDVGPAVAIEIGHRNSASGDVGGERRRESGGAGDVFEARCEHRRAGEQQAEAQRGQTPMSLREAVRVRHGLTDAKVGRLLLYSHVTTTLSPSRSVNVKGVGWLEGGGF